jgi:hypothetical protein
MFCEWMHHFISSATATKLKDKPGQRLSLVGMAFPTAATKETAMYGFSNSGLWPVDRNVFTHADFSPSMVTHATHAATPETPKQTPGYNGYIPVEKISPLLSNSAQHRGHSQERNTLHLV